MDNQILSNAAVLVNNQACAIVPNSLKYSEGLGEQKLKPASGGGGNVQLMYADDISTRISKVSFELFPTKTNIDLARQWKNNGNANVIRMTSVSGFSRTIQQAAFVGNYEVSLGVDGNIAVEFQGATAS